MEPTIYKPGAYKSPGIYNGAGGIYKGRGVYNEGGIVPPSGILYTLCDRCQGNKDIPLAGPDSEVLDNYEFLNPGYKFTRVSTGPKYLWTNLGVENFEHAEIEFYFGGLFVYTFWIQFLLNIRLIHADGGNGSIPNKNAIRFQNINSVSSNISLINEGANIKYAVLGSSALETYKVKIDFDGDYYILCFGDNYENWVKFRTSEVQKNIYSYMLSGSGSDIYLYKVIIQ